MRPVFLASLLAVAATGAAWGLGTGLASQEPDVETRRVAPTLVARDSSGFGHHAIIQGQVELGLAGRFGSSYSFDERDSWLMVPPSPDLNPEDRDFMVTAWISLRTSPDPGETYDVVRKGISFTVPGEFKLEVLPRDRVRCTAKDSEKRTARVSTGDVQVLDGNWHLIGCARTGRLWSVLADDTITSRPTDLGVVENDVALSIGSKYGMEDQPSGRLDEVRLAVGRRYYTGRVDARTRLEALRRRAPTALWRLDESSSGRAPGR